jgi:hypothetical protein
MQQIDRRRNARRKLTSIAVLKEQIQAAAESYSKVESSAQI